MRQHPIPQNVTQYQFRLVGNMTLKQFLELAGGLILAYLVYLSNLLIIIKLPLSALFGLLGVGMAFFPLAERPLDQWILNFFKAIYSPTLYRWQKQPHLPSIFTYTPTTVPSPPKSKSTSSKTNPQTPTPISSSDSITDEDLSSKLFRQINQLLDQFPSTPPAAASTKPAPPHPSKPSIRIRKLKFPPNNPNQPLAFTHPTPPPPNSSLTPPVTNQTHPTSPTPPKSKVIFQTPTTTKESIKQTAQTETIDIAPLTPAKPNLIAGLVTDSNQKLLPNLIVEIVDQQGIPQRAVKTNALGQFSISTPLPPGEYFVKVDNEQLNIPAQKITVNNQIIPPLHLHPNQQSTTRNQP